MAALTAAGYAQDVDAMAIAAELGHTGLCVVPGFLSPKALRETRDDLDDLRQDGAFDRAGTGQGSREAVRDGVRRDEIHWLDRRDGGRVQSALWRDLDALREAFNRTLYLGLSDFEGHYAAYPKDGFCERHLDCFQHDDARMVSLVLYLNMNWQPPDGGQLRVYGSGAQDRAPDGDGADAHVDVDPRGGTMVCFLSRESEHEVLPSHAERFSFTGWFRRPAPVLRQIAAQRA